MVHFACACLANACTAFKMEAEEKKEKFLSALLTEPNIKDISQLAQKLVKRLYLNIYYSLNYYFFLIFRKRLFEDISVETTALVFLTGTQFSHVHKGEIIY